MSSQAPNQKIFSQAAQFNANNMRYKQEPNLRYGSPSVSQMGDQQMPVFDQYPISSQKQLLNINGQFNGEIYQDEGTNNIYTEPTLIDHNVGHDDGIRSKLISGVPPLPPPPPIFSVSVIEAVTTTSTTLNQPNIAYPSSNGTSLVGVVNINDNKTFVDQTNAEFNYIDMVAGQSCDSIVHQPSHSGLTITGQDLEITLNNGEITQTVLGESVDVPSVNNIPYSPQLLYYYSNQRVEFLPLCDLLFNIISLAAYFCDVVFDSVTAYTLYLNDQILWMVVALILILTSATLSQLLSYKWYLRERRYSEQSLRLQRAAQANNAQNENNNNIMSNRNSPYELRSPFTLAITHILFGGVLLRYFKLFVPVNLSTVKREVRDLCVLRMVHGFCEAAPMLLLQV